MSACRCLLQPTAIPPPLLTLLLPLLLPLRLPLLLPLLLLLLLLTFVSWGPMEGNIRERKQIHNT